MKHVTRRRKGYIPGQTRRDAEKQDADNLLRQVDAKKATMTVAQAIMLEKYGKDGWEGDKH